MRRGPRIGTLAGWSAALLAVAVLAAPLVAGAVTGLGTTALAPVPDNAVKLTHIADLDAPTAMAVRPSDPDLYVAQQDGRVVAVSRDGGDEHTALDLRDKVLDEGEQGLLGLTFSPDGRQLYVHYSDVDGNTEVEAYAFADGKADPDSGREVLHLEQPQTNHKGGELTFGPDGMLWLGLGDGGSEGDEGPGHAEGGNGQSLDTLLGKIVRIDPHPSRTEAYTIPADNPFAGGGGQPEIWAYGLRNPWRFSFDRTTGDLWIGDVGGDDWEEIDFAPAPERGRGVNFGWNLFEGDHRSRVGTSGGVEPPIFEESHADGNCAITGGYVYRGKRVRALRGTYVYTDYCNGELRGIRQRDGEVVAKGSLGVDAGSVSSFGQDAAGELYVLSQTDGLFRILPR